MPRSISQRTISDWLSEKEVVNFSDWCDFFAFDVMGDLGFGEDFDMLNKGILKKSFGIRGRC